MERSLGEMDPFRVESAPIIVRWRENRRPDALCGNRRLPLPVSHNPISQVRALSITGPAGGKALPQGKSPRFRAWIRPGAGPVLVAKNLHLLDFLLIFHRDST
jgi:hypothetical protein